MKRNNAHLRLKSASDKPPVTPLSLLSKRPYEANSAPTGTGAVSEGFTIPLLLSPTSNSSLAPSIPDIKYASFRFGNPGPKFFACNSKPCMRNPFCVALVNSRAVDQATPIGRPSQGLASTVKNDRPSGAVTPLVSLKCGATTKYPAKRNVMPSHQRKSCATLKALSVSALGKSRDNRAQKKAAVKRPIAIMISPAALEYSACMAWSIPTPHIPAATKPMSAGVYFWSIWLDKKCEWTCDGVPASPSGWSNLHQKPDEAGGSGPRPSTFAYIIKNQILTALSHQQSSVR